MNVVYLVCCRKFEICMRVLTNTTLDDWGVGGRINFWEVERFQVEYLEVPNVQCSRNPNNPFRLLNSI